MHREAEGEAQGPRHWPRDIPVRSSWEEGEGERERPRKVSRRLVKKAAGWTRGRARRPRGEAERRRGTHTGTEETWWFGGEESDGGGQVPALPRAPLGGWGVTVDTIRIPRSDGRDGREHDMGMDAGQDG